MRYGLRVCRHGRRRPCDAKWRYTLARKARTRAAGARFTDFIEMRTERVAYAFGDSVVELMSDSGCSGMMKYAMV